MTPGGGSASSPPPGQPGVSSAASVPASRVNGWELDPFLTTFRDEMPRLGEVTPGRRVHILDGDGDGVGGGHRWDSDIPGKSRFPRSWSDDKIIDMVQDVAERPDVLPVRQDNDRWQCRGTRDQILMLVIVNPDGSVRTARPIDGPGVTRNPR